MNLIELLITLVIISILSVFSFASYTDYVTKSLRTSASTSLMKLSLALQAYNVEHNTFQDATLTNLNITSPKNYLLAITKATDTDFIITATPLASQASRDTKCATLLLTSDGEKNISGNGGIEACWT